jgi:hypothetical protein
MLVVFKKAFSVRDMWKVMNADGVVISYFRLEQRLRKLRQEGRIWIETRIEL